MTTETEGNTKFEVLKKDTEDKTSKYTKDAAIYAAVDCSAAGSYPMVLIQDGAVWKMRREKANTITAASWTIVAAKDLAKVKEQFGVF